VKFWLGLQDDYDVEEEMSKKAKEFKAIKQYKINAA
jgi:plasmid maintenance system antidote protein VapI